LFTGGNDDGIFEIDENSGIITLNKTLNASVTLSHVLQIQAYDTVNMATLNVTVNVRTGKLIKKENEETILPLNFYFLNSNQFIFYIYLGCNTCNTIFMSKVLDW
jgi:hypothetical protein